MNAPASLYAIIGLWLLVAGVFVVVLARMLRPEPLWSAPQDDECLSLERAFLAEDYESGVCNRQEFVRRARSLGMPENEIHSIVGF